MNNYVALLRGINVGGNSLVKMADLKIAFEKNGFTNVRTYINSGNVLFESDENPQTITDRLEDKLSTMFHMNLRVVVLSHNQLKAVVDNIPTEWKKGHDLRCYIAFIKEPITPEDVIKEITLKEGTDSVKAGKHVLYMSTKLDGLTSSGFTKLIAKKIYQNMTMRNLNTTQKLLSLMEQHESVHP